MEVNILILTGQGDTDFKIVNDEIFRWVVSDFPHEQLPNGSGVDPFIPQIVTDGLIAQAIDDAERFGQQNVDDYTQIQIGQRSYCNDRALNVPNVACVERFSDMISAINYCVENELKIKDSMEGYIY